MKSIKLLKIHSNVFSTFLLLRLTVFGNKKSLYHNIIYKRNPWSQKRKGDKLICFRKIFKPKEKLSEIYFSITITQIVPVLLHVIYPVMDHSVHLLSIDFFEKDESEIQYTYTNHFKWFKFNERVFCLSFAMNQSVPFEPSLLACIFCNVVPPNTLLIPLPN